MTVALGRLLNCLSLGFILRAGVTMDCSATLLLTYMYKTGGPHGPKCPGLQTSKDKSNEVILKGLDRWSEIAVLKLRVFVHMALFVMIRDRFWHLRRRTLAKHLVLDRTDPVKKNSSQIAIMTLLRNTGLQQRKYKV